MDKYRAIPEGFMLAGEVAKKMNTTVRTLQYYDKEGVLSPSAESEGGRRLYTDKDVVKLHQIQSMKYLGFSLADIKDRLVSLDTPAQVADALASQADVIRDKIASLIGALEAAERLRAETLKMERVDWKKYADIILLLQNGVGELAWVVRSLDEKTLEHGLTSFDEESSARIISTWHRLCDEAAHLIESEISPKSEQGHALAKAWWDMILDFTGGDVSMIPELDRFAEHAEDWDDAWKTRWSVAEPYIGKALESYFKSIDVNPFEKSEGGSPSC